MRMTSDHCPPDRAEIAEAYVLTRLSPADAIAFEEHYIACAACAAVLQETALYIDAMKAAAEKLNSNPACTFAAGGPGKSA